MSGNEQMDQDLEEGAEGTVAVLEKGEVVEQPAPVVDVLGETEEGAIAIVDEAEGTETEVE